MANNVPLDPMSGGSEVRTTEDSNQKHHQHILPEFQDVDNSNLPTVVDQDNPFPTEALGLESRIGNVTASPAANTVLARLKTLDTLLSAPLAKAIIATYRDADIDNSAQAVLAAAGKVVGYHIYNPNTSEVFLQFYNTAAGGVTPGTTTPVRTIIIPPRGVIDTALPYELPFSTAITIAATTTATGGTDPTTGLVGEIDYIED